MDKEIKLYCNENGKLEIYDDTWDITIHCRNEEENKMARRILAQEPGWIPIEEKIPDPDKYLLLSFSNFSVPMVGRYMAIDDRGGIFMEGDTDETFVQNNLFVNAWMYLPKCYRKEEEQ